jgi:hypothetical protein
MEARMLRRLIPVSIVLAGLVPATPSHALVVGADFDAMPLGPYAGPAMIAGNPANFQVASVQNPTPNVPLPPTADGNMLCIDARDKSVQQIITFDFYCDAISEPGMCELSFSYSGLALYTGAGFRMYIDWDGTPPNPAEQWDPIVGPIGSTTLGSFHRVVGACLGNPHRISIVVLPGTLVYLDGFAAECQLGTPTSAATWGSLKATYR